MLVEKSNKTRYFISLFFLQLFERFSFFGFFYILIFFCINNLALTESRAAVFAGSFTALCYMLSSLGGYISDNYLGVRRTLFVGGFNLCVGYLLLASGTTLGSLVIYLGLAMVVVGACMFVPMTLNSVSRLYSDEAEKLDSVYAYFNMANNFGALTGAILVPYLCGVGPAGADDKNYALALSVCAFGVLLALVNVFFNKKLFYSISTPIGKKALGLAQSIRLALAFAIFVGLVSVLLYNDSLVNIVLVVGVVSIVSYFIYLTFQQDKKNRLKMLLLLVFIFYAIIFFMIYAQKTTSFFLFNVHHVDLNVLGFKLNSQTVPGLLNTSGIIIFSPLLAIYFNRLGDRLSSAAKFALCLMFSGLCYGFLALVCAFSDPSLKISFWWEVFAVGVLFSWAEIMATAVGLSLITQLVPVKIRGFCMGMWFLTWALGIKLGSFFASLFASDSLEDSQNSLLVGQDKIQSFIGYEHLFIWIMVVTLGASFSLFLFKKKMNKIIHTDS